MTDILSTHKNVLLVTGNDHESKSGGHYLVKKWDVRGHAVTCTLDEVTPVLLSLSDVIITCGPAATKAYRKMTVKDGRKILTLDDAGRLMGTTYDPKSLYNSPIHMLSLLSDCNWITSHDELPTERAVTMVDSLVQLDPSKGLSIDIETTGLKFEGRDQHILTIAVTDHTSATYATDNVYSVVGYLRDKFLIGQNIKFDMNWLQYFFGEFVFKCWDTGVAAFLLEDWLPDNSLGFLSTRITRRPFHKDMVDVKNLVNEPIDRVLEYNAIDTATAMEVYQHQLPEIKKRGKLPIMKFIMDLVLVFSRIERRGTYIDKAMLETETVMTRKYLENTRARLPKELNLDSPKQVKAWLQDNGIFTDKTDKDTLREFLWVSRDEGKKQLVTDLLKYRKHSKRMNTYLTPMPGWIEADGRVHTTYWLYKSTFASGFDGMGGAGTGRTSSSNPNLQNIPKGSAMRNLFRAAPGFWWWDADYSQLEMRVAAGLSRDPKLLRIYEQGFDFHTGSMADLFGYDYDKMVALQAGPGKEHWKVMRVIQKTINFGIMYGIGAEKVSRSARLDAGVDLSVSEAQDKIDAWKENFHVYMTWAEARGNEAAKTGKVLLPNGRERTILGADRQDWIGWRGRRQAVNAPIQGLASDVNLCAAILLDKCFREDFGGKVHLLMSVHDQLAGEADNCIDKQLLSEAIRDIMENKVVEDFNTRFNMDLGVPMGIDMNTGECWS